MAEYASTKTFEAETKRSVLANPARSSDSVWAYTVLRLSFGANIMLHGVSRLFAGHAAFLGYLNHYFEKTPLVSASLLPLFAWVLPPVETLLGLLLVLGLWTRFALNRRRAGAGDVGYRNKSGTGLERRRTPVDLRFPLLLPAGSSRPKHGLHRWNDEPVSTAFTNCASRERKQIGFRGQNKT